MDRNNLEASIAVFSHDAMSSWELFSNCLSLVNLTVYNMIKLTPNYFQNA